MSAATFTPGPWVASPFTVRDRLNQIEVADCVTERNQTLPLDEREANARLIAAAPELLEALLFIVNDAEPGEDAQLTVEGYNRACAAIAKAREGSAD